MLVKAISIECLRVAMWTPRFQMTMANDLHSDSGPTNQRCWSGESRGVGPAPHFTEAMDGLLRTSHPPPSAR